MHCLVNEAEASCSALANHGNAHTHMHARIHSRTTRPAQAETILHFLKRNAIHSSDLRNQFALLLDLKPQVSTTLLHKSKDPSHSTHGMSIIFFFFLTQMNWNTFCNSYFQNVSLTWDNIVFSCDAGIFWKHGCAHSCRWGTLIGWGRGTLSPHNHRAPGLLWQTERKQCRRGRSHWQIRSSQVPV